MKSKALIFILIYLIIDTFFCLQVATAQIKERQQLHILKESGQQSVAYEGYKAAIAEHPESTPLILDFVEFLISMERFDESWNRLEKIRPEDINALTDNDKRRVSLFKAQIFTKREEFDTAISEIEPFTDSKDVQLFLADVYFMGGQWRKSLRILGEVRDSVYYTPHERALALKKIAYIRRLYASRINVDSGVVDSKAHGSIPWSFISGEIPIYENDRLTASYLWMDGGDCFSVGWNGFSGRFPSVELLLTITDYGDAGGSLKKIFYPIKKSRAEIKGYYNEVERELTAMMDEFSLKEGGSFRFDYEFSDILTGSCKYEYSVYPQGYMNILNVSTTFAHHLSVKKITLYHSGGMLLVEGNGDEDYIAHHLYMPSYTFRLSYIFSNEYSDHIDFKIGLGYLFGIEDEGFVFSPGCIFNLHVHKNVIIKGGAEYRLDGLSGEDEWRINAGIKILF
ncbi:MAG: tetratricopeptide repeat protein [Thermodesulfobacteriota bacterium]|nr:tetratricopeptide repeat protein [Thermodesulfobacteriota bacterium]